MKLTYIALSRSGYEKYRNRDTPVGTALLFHEGPHPLFLCSLFCFEFSSTMRYFESQEMQRFFGKAAALSLPPAHDTGT